MGSPTGRPTAIIRDGFRGGSAELPSAGQGKVLRSQPDDKSANDRQCAGAKYHRVTDKRVRSISSVRVVLRPFQAAGAVQNAIFVIISSA